MITILILKGRWQLCTPIFREDSINACNCQCLVNFVKFRQLPFKSSKMVLQFTICYPRLFRLADICWGGNQMGRVRVGLGQFYPSHGLSQNRLIGSDFRLFSSGMVGFRTGRIRVSLIFKIIGLGWIGQVLQVE